ncbi:MAG TPA: DNA-processing protein DprA [Kofleriaceae bacterium]
MTTAKLAPDRLPQRLVALGWSRDVYVRGALPVENCVAIVGARAATQAAMDRAFVLGRDLTARGYHVVSGGALGIDGAAHRGALAAGGATTVILGGGVDIAYPARHAALFAEIQATGGTIASLVPDGTEPRGSLFVQRNRLIAALSKLVIVVEAELRSGSLTTAAAARDLQIQVGAGRGSRGCERLLATGAVLVESADDAEAALRGTPRVFAAAETDPVSREVRDAIAGGAASIDAIVERTGLTARAVLRALPTLERMQ